MKKHTNIFWLLFLLAWHWWYLSGLQERERAALYWKVKNIFFKFSFSSAFAGAPALLIGLTHLPISPTLSLGLFPFAFGKTKTQNLHFSQTYPMSKKAELRFNLKSIWHQAPSLSKPSTVCLTSPMEAFFMLRNMKYCRPGLRVGKAWSHLNFSDWSCLAQDLEAN